MADVAEYRHGMPCWVDLATTDPDGARAFYTGLLGWESERPAGATLYEVLTLRGLPVAGLMPLSPPMLEAGVPPTWTSYVYVDDVDDAVSAATAAGGQVPGPAFSPAPGLRIAIAIDPGSAVIGFLEGPREGGARVMDEPGAITWFELATRTPEAAATFYEDVFAWEARSAPVGGQAYTVFAAEDREVAGMIEMDDSWGGAAPRWGICFAVEDCDETLARAGELGGRAAGEALTISGIGRYAALSDPQGAEFAVIGPEPAA
jgi:predicted enzyme related to lactoylglutathione lyase